MHVRVIWYGVVARVTFSCARVFIRQVTWVEHMEIEDRVPIHLLYRDLILSGAAFGAHRWLAALQRACERCACLVTAGMPHRDIAAAGGVFVCFLMTWSASVAL